jgi:hypothetical protein
VLTRTAYLARLDYSTAQPARDAIASLIIAAPPRALPPAAQGTPTQGPPSADAVPADPGTAARPLPGPGTARGKTKQLQADDGQDTNLDVKIIAAAAVIVAEARRRNEPLGQKALGRRLRDDGYRVGNDSLRALLTAACGHLDANPPSGPGQPAAGHRVNGGHTALTARLPGHEPGPDGARLPGPA